MPSRFIRVLLIITGILSLVVITIPELGIIPLITVIGIPLAYLYWAIPGFFLGLLIFTVFRGVLPFRGFPSLFMSSLLTLAVLQFGASLINNRILADVNALQTGDVNRISLPLSTRVIAYRSVEKGCDVFCVNALLSGAADRFLVLRWDASEPNIVPDTIVRSYQFKRQAACHPLYNNGAREHRNLNLVPDSASGSGTVSVAQLLSLANAKGHCLTESAARLGEADIIISRGPIQSGRSIRKLGFHFGGDTISAFRTRVYKRNVESSRYAEIFRRTTGKYALVYAPLFSGPNFGYGLDAGVGWNWKEQFFNREKYPARGSWPDFLTQTLGMDFSISPSDQSAAVSTSVEKYREDVQDMMAAVIRSGDLPNQAQ